MNTHAFLRRPRPADRAGDRGHLRRQPLPMHGLSADPARRCARFARDYDAGRRPDAEVRGRPVFPLKVRGRPRRRSRLDGLPAPDEARPAPLLGAAAGSGSARPRSARSMGSSGCCPPRSAGSRSGSSSATRPPGSIRTRSRAYLIDISQRSRAAGDRRRGRRDPRRRGRLDPAADRRWPSADRRAARRARRRAPRAGRGTASSSPATRSAAPGASPATSSCRDHSRRGDAVPLRPVHGPGHARHDGRRSARPTIDGRPADVPADRDARGRGPPRRRGARPFHIPLHPAAASTCRPTGSPAGRRWRTRSSTPASAAGSTTRAGGPRGGRRVVFGGLAPMNVRAAGPSRLLAGKPWDEETLREALAVLRAEMPRADRSRWTRKGFSRDYRRSWRRTSSTSSSSTSPRRVDPGEVAPANLSAAEHAGAARSPPGRQTLEIQPEHCPLTRPIIKRAAFAQATGEAITRRTCRCRRGAARRDGQERPAARPLPVHRPGRRARRARGPAQGAVPRLPAIVTAADIPAGGSNLIGLGDDDPVFSDGVVTSVGAPIGLAVARDRADGEARRPRSSGASASTTRTCPRS